MSERDDPPIRVTFGEKVVELTRKNVALYTFWGEAATYNHVFVAVPEQESADILRGGHIFVGHDLYEMLVEFVIQKDCPQYLNMLSVPDNDVNAYVQQNVVDLGSADSFPEAWNGSVS